jgi:Integrase zinc binding domain
LEEYGPELHYIKGEHNIVADALSRLDMVKEPITEPLSQEAAATLFAGDEAEFDFPQDFQLSYAEIQHRQEQDKYIKKRLQESNLPYKKEDFPISDTTFKLVTNKDGKIVLPKALQTRAVKYYHVILCHPGETRTELTMAQHYYAWKGMRNTVVNVCKRCHMCQVNKPKLRPVGHIHPKKAEEGPSWETLCIDLIGPYTIQGVDKEELTLHCLTMINPVTGRLV